LPHLWGYPIILVHSQEILVWQVIPVILAVPMDIEVDSDSWRRHTLKSRLEKLFRDVHRQFKRCCCLLCPLELGRAAGSVRLWCSLSTLHWCLDSCPWMNFWIGDFPGPMLSAPPRPVQRASPWWWRCHQCFWWSICLWTNSCLRQQSRLCRRNQSFDLRRSCHRLGLPDSAEVSDSYRNPSASSLTTLAWLIYQFMVISQIFLRLQSPSSFECSRLR